MIRLRFFLLTTLLLLLAFRLPGQPPSLYSDSQSGVPVVCNDGTIPFSVARAFWDFTDLFLGQNIWVVQGWYNVDPGKCNQIGKFEHYTGGGLFGQDSVTLLAFAFWDSTGVFGGIKVQAKDSGWFYPMYPANQQICVSPGTFRYTQDSPKLSELTRECEHAPAGYFLIPASFMYKGSTCASAPYCDADSDLDRLHIKLGPNDRAIPSGQRNPPLTSGNPSGKVAPKPSTEAPKSAADASTADRREVFLKAVGEDVAAYIEASRTGFNSYKKGEPLVQQGVRMWESNTKPVLAKNCWVVQGDAATTLSCLLSTSADLNGLRSYYTELTDDVTASLPAGWAPQAAPPYGPDFPASKGYRSSLGAHGEIWIARAASGEYELHYQLVTADARAKPAANPPPYASDDDPIGNGGFVSPPSR